MCASLRVCLVADTLLDSNYASAGVRGGKYADVNNASALRDLSKMYITFVPGLQDAESAKEQEYV